ncbi:MAG: iron dicitrate transport regulator FecR [Hydrogenophaga sp.]|uniref:iron dicitrate transport regulator FecR n=1 Tax=Hydrogenophaga sp. TaxID=1904254 RepID=UPI001DA1989B|nr:iron dicitrate transport regulator FecR [Hydrogenophaga sp.]MBX3609992.1 iron dicitrate transport regulator FecR [Hydrogenophaga sp.]
MSQHTLQGRTESEVTWYQRRETLKAAAAWIAMGGMPAAMAQSRSNIVDLVGDVLVNGERLVREQIIQTGDQIVSGPASRLVFMLGNAAFHVRQNSQLTVERGRSINTMSLLRLLGGAVVSVFGPSSYRAISTPTLTAGIRGTGVYTEVMAAQGGRTYFCNCYGRVELERAGQNVLSQSVYHQSFWGEAEPKGGRYITPAGAINHTDEELEFLAQLIDQRTAWQIMGKKGIKDGRGFMEPQGEGMHPAYPR